jgi:hypothetical protein
MTVGFPTNTVVLLVAAMIGTGVSIWLILSLTLRQMAIPQRTKHLWRWGAALILSVWLIARLRFAIDPPNGAVISVPALVAFLTFGLVAGTLPLVISPTFRQIVRALPETWIVGVHAVRILGFVFLALMDMKLLPAQFALPAGLGDMTVGLLAPVVAYLLARRYRYARILVIGWNILGLLDFVTAIATGGAYIGPFATQLATSGVSLSYLNFVLLIPSFAVPLLALLHIYSLIQMLSPRADVTQQEVEKPTPSPVLTRGQRSAQP